MVIEVETSTPIFTVLSPGAVPPLNVPGLYRVTNMSTERGTREPPRPTRAGSDRLLERFVRQQILATR